MRILLVLLLISPFICEAYVDFYAGPEVYKVVRWRDGGTKQCGRSDGVRIGVDRICNRGLYLGADAFYSQGLLKGHTGRGARLRSELTDTIVEGRIGYTIAQATPRLHTMTFFAGYGYFYETNDFTPPSRLPVKFTNTFKYPVVGFLAGFNFTPMVSIGLNFKMKFMQDGQTKVSEDPLFPDVTLMMNDETQYRLEVPLSFFQCWRRCFVALIPFYEHRHFGGREGFPFDFIDTKFSLTGARFAFDCWF